MGEWAVADDGIRFRVAKLTRGRVSQVASGGRPGAPMVVVTIQVRNDSSKRFDLTMLNVATRVGADGQEAEEVFDMSYGDHLDGTLARGRTASARYAFAADRAADLQKVSVEITPGLEYDSYTFEGSA